MNSKKNRHIKMKSRKFKEKHNRVQNEMKMCKVHKQQILQWDKESCNCVHIQLKIIVKNDC